MLWIWVTTSGVLRDRQLPTYLLEATRANNLALKIKALNRENETLKHFLRVVQLLC